ncbi:MAG: hypothetical protein A2600_07655 [Candidatus Lambdaproteobacteria bacterium RIFOXYD1_FULL_56_27]|uniref:Divergent polysaccharide deacetylase family protein n=1 Tax=Candidatus Lambdaproteobacteria bacterium RIFOXYD2_FULL_56_26 TaxID=1817773 RepID=A0A1F6GZE9_9PROT|nr:MAG: hypothetical protein A2426_08295 [Candidatus Lambdaproteobacteria bacterium RIFOXYC1_FULL_56_13]OGH03518.1 MAG: hypothetical protein A2557_01020 [Candidatus Lambdaproteobacteria bacterium RIFOXYD2_FULL_56_26]OGH09641.1 MAG: hypothetical protein A2600_07655 [Candidatus Lambdaproteobacteria bacterium RIFOXYD1_FULL_56_27]
MLPAKAPFLSFKTRWANPQLFQAALGMLALGLGLLFLWGRNPDFPSDLPSAQTLDIREESYQAQKDFTNRLSGFLREGHGGLLLVKETDRVASVEGMVGHGYVTYLQKYNKINEKQLFALTQEFAGKEGLGVKVHKLAPKYGATKLPSYEFDFLKEGELWVRVEAQLGAQAKVPGQPDTLAQPALPGSAPVVAPGSARLVVIIDDMGQNLSSFSQFSSLSKELTFSVLPQLPYSQRVAEAAHQLGAEVMLHLPMEPVAYPKNNPGAGALMVSDGLSFLAQKLKADLDSVPYAVGVNNHMGSAFTKNQPGMALVMQALAERGLFYLDSRTSASEVALGEAQRFGIPFFSRQVFLDEVPGEEAAKAALEKAITLALKEGTAVAIGHPRPETLAALKALLPQLKERGVTLVRASSLQKS